MKCTKCQGEWTPPANKSLTKCPFCHADILQMLNEQAEVLSTEVILANMLQAYGTDLLHNQQRLTAMISDLFAHDHKTKQLLLLSVREGIPAQLLALANDSNRCTHIFAIQTHLAEDKFIKNDIAQIIVTIWTNALGYNIEEPYDNFEIVWQSGFCGIQNSKGEMITPYKYDDAYPFKEGLASVKLNRKWGCVNNTGKEIIATEYNYCALIYNNILRCDTEFYTIHFLIVANEVVELEGFVCGDFVDGLLKVDRCEDSGGGYGFYNKAGKLITSRWYDWIEDFHEGLAEVSLDRKYGFIDKNGNEIIPLIYDRTSSELFGNKERYNEGLILVNLRKKYGFLDNTGREVIPFKYDLALAFSEGLAIVNLGFDDTKSLDTKNGKYGFIDNKGNEVIPIKYDFAENFSNGLARVKLDQKWGFINKIGKEVLPLKYGYAFSFSEGLAAVSVNHKSGFIDLNGNKIIPFKYYYACSFREGLAKVNLNGKWGFIDKQGNEIIPIQYDNALSFREGLAAVKFNDKWGFFDKSGKEIIPFIYDSAFKFIEGLARVKLNGKEFYIDKLGNWVKDK